MNTSKQSKKGLLDNMEEKTITYRLGKKKSGHDSRDVYFFVDGEEYRKIGYYAEDDGQVCMIYCPSCDRENYAIVVATGKCAWCPFDPNTDAKEEKWK